MIEIKVDISKKKGQVYKKIDGMTSDILAEMLIAIHSMYETLSDQPEAQELIRKKIHEEAFIYDIKTTNRKTLT